MTIDEGQRAARKTLLPTGILAVVLVAYFLIAVQYAARTPAWQVPDEPAHYNYVRAIVEQAALPVLQFGDYDQAYNEQFTNPKNTPNLSIDPLRYEFHQPPLYYLLAAPTYALSGGDRLALRLMSVAFGGALIVVAYRIACRVTPDRPELALGAAAFVAFVPQHVAMMAGVNNDSLAELLLALIVLQTLRVSAQGGDEARRELLLLGALLGLGLIAKTTAYLSIPVVAVALFFRSARHASRTRRDLILVAAPALALGSAWWLRNLSVYGGFDILGLARHNAVVAGQPLTSDWIARLGFGPYLFGALSTTFHSFWGQFGWMGAPMPDAVYLALGALSLFAVAGWLSTLRARMSQPVILLAVLTLGAFASYTWYNITFVQHQGRYLFPALIPLGLIFSIGVDRWARRLPRPIGQAVYIGVFAMMAALDVVALYRFIVPSLTA